MIDNSTLGKLILYDPQLIPKVVDHDLLIRLIPNNPRLLTLVNDKKVFKAFDLFENLEKEYYTYSISSVHTQEHFYKSRMWIIFCPPPGMDAPSRTDCVFNGIDYIIIYSRSFHFLKWCKYLWNYIWGK